jgi:hypothetical protein
MALAIIAILVTFVLARGQERLPEPKPVPLPTPNNAEVVKNKIFQLKYIEPSRLIDLLGQIGIAMPAVDDRMKVLIVESSAAKVEAVGEIVKTLDVPQRPAKNVELTAYLLAAMPQPARSNDLPSLPSELSEVATQLKRALNLQNIYLWNTILVRMRDGEGTRVVGTADTALPEKDQFVFAIRRLDIGTGEKDPTIHLRDLNLSIIGTPPSSEAKGSTKKTNYAELGTDIDVPIGRKVVVGKTSIFTPDFAVVLVLTARVVD